MQSTLQSTMIRASAGSGKTWQLANRFLALMALGVAPEKIIALTFTRKAAGEFTGRIMTRLAVGAADAKGAGELAEELVNVIQGTDSIPALVNNLSGDLPVMDAVFFQVKLETLIASLDRLALSTLDSYFVRIVRNFSLELGLSGFDLMEDSAISAERLSVMGSIFSSQKTSQSERETFLQSFKQATWGEEENRLCKPLEEFVKKHQNRWLSAPEPAQWGGSDHLWEGDCPYPSSGDIPQKAQALSDLMGPSVSPNKIYMNGWLKACEILEDYLPGTPVKVNAQLKRAIPIWDHYANGTHIERAKKYEITPEIGAAMTDLIGSYIHSEIEIRLKRTQGLYRVIAAYEDHYHQHVRSRGRLCFSDLTLLLAGEGAMDLWDAHSRDLIDYRLDARYDHWLLDEFQDTSQPQWKAIGNLVDEIMQDTEGQRSVFVVGDSKQSIYGWRGGEPRLFNELRAHYGDRMAEWEMDRSYRSSQHVLDLVNTVCDLSHERWKSLFPAAAVDRWLFHPHVPDKEKAGHTLVLETTLDPKAKPEEKTTARYACAKALIEKINPLDHGLTCAILVGKNAQVSGIVDYLRRELPDTPVASESETTIADGPEGSAILDLFRWLRNPDHTFGLVHVSLSPLGDIIEDLSDSKDARSQWSYLTSEVALYGIQPLVGKIIIALQQSQKISPYGQSRLDEILAAATDFTSTGGTLDEWVTSLESRSLRETTREGVIQVMTVHKCKGLGFDIVILPELDSRKKFTDSSRLDTLERKGELGATDYVIKKPTHEICQADPALKPMIDTWEAEQCYERFCNLYVSLTRAVHATYCILDPVGEKWEPKQNFADWIREATARSAESEIEIQSEAYGVLYQSGDWLDIEEKKRTPEPAPDTTLPPAQARMGRLIPSGKKPLGKEKLLQSGKGMRFGNIVHKHFEKITWVDEIPQLDKGIAADLVLECLGLPSIRPHFERPAGDFQLLREQPFETQHDGQWISGMIDRAVIHLENGKATRITLIDFKTDTGKTAEALKDSYTAQIESYRQALAAITQVPEKNITAYLLSTSLKEMVEL